MVSPHPQQPVFTDEAAAALLEAAYKAVEAWPKPNLPRMDDDRPEALRRINKEIKWPYNITGSSWVHYIQVTKVLSELDRLHDIAVGKNPTVNQRLAESKGWAVVLLSPEEQALIDSRRKVTA